MTLKVCMTTLEYPPDVGGVGESVQRIAKMLSALGYEVHVAVFHSKLRKVGGVVQPGVGSNTEQCSGIWVHRIMPPVRSEQPMVQDFLSEIYAQMKLLHHRYHFHLFHSFFISETGFLTTLLAKEQGVPVISSIRGSDLHKHIFGAKLHSQLVWTLENSDWTTYVSQDLQTRAQVLTPAVTHRSSVFWNSIVPIDFTDLPTPALTEKLRGVVIGSVGRFRDKKGIEYLLEACRSLQDKLEFTLLFVGDYALREKDYWLKQMADSGLGDRLMVTGLVDHATALAYLPHIDIFAIPSLHDGCPNAMLEAMLAQRAIIGTTVDAIGDILDHGTDGLLVPPMDAERLAEAILQLAQSSELRQNLGKAAYQKVTQQLAPAVEQRNWQQVYKRVLNPLIVEQPSNGASPSVRDFEYVS